MYRQATMADAEAIYGLICDLEERALPKAAFFAILEGQLRQKEQYLCLVCEKEGRVIAVMNLRLEGQLHHAARIAEILEFAVAKDQRGQGIGKAFFSYACQRAQAAGCIQIELCTNQLREDAHRFYAREGMHNFHYKFSKSFLTDCPENRIGR